ncbi:glycosyltransferase family protein [Gluconobacter cerinus]|uniref:tetratricopeptide repeat protein n=1 Tax=Gluconobacter cerinus TaxID=38307 RepID=UPI00193F054D|nr:tetratricopeptide repeat-containing glycosyltransferase family protein [Gluconobacter cerinus]MBM3097327.1 glycosyltransferase family protein [Gluconobacter cerinus]
MTTLSPSPCLLTRRTFTEYLRVAVGLEEVGQRESAIDVLREAETLLPERPESLFLLGGVYERLQCWEKASLFYGQALEARPHAARVWHRLGIALLHQDDLGGSIKALDTAVQQDPAIPEYATDLSMVLSRDGQFEAALGFAQSALKMQPDDGNALNNAGHILQCLNRSAEALQFYDAALQRSPDHPVIRFGRATALLKSGDFLLGWQEYESRWLSSRTVRADIDAPVWEGESLKGCTILVHHEQGYGDTLHFIRLMPILAQRGAEVVVQVPVPLVRLMQRVAGVSRVVSVLDPADCFDYHCPMMSLPVRLGLTAEFVGQFPYLSVSEEDMTTQGGKLSAQVQGSCQPPDFIVGLVWSGDPRPHDLRATQTDRRRSMSLETLRPLFSVKGVRFVSFQMGAARHQVAETGLPLVDGTENILDFADTAARLSAVDLLITVDTSMAHLAGGLGKPVWMLSRSDACWRWGDAGTQTAWYPDMRIFRQPVAGDWGSVVDDVRLTLVQLMDLYRGYQHESGE